MMNNERDRDPGIILSSVMSCISDLVVQMAEDLGNGANEFSEEGASIMNFLDLADSKIGRFDMRIVDEKELIPELQRFSEHAEIIDTDLNRSKQNALIRYLDKRIDKLRVSVEEEWNTSLPPESKKEECDVNDWLFLKKEEEKLSYTCEEDGCSSTFNNGQSYQRHLKKKHEVKRAVKMPTVTCRLQHTSGEDAQIADHQITAHLKNVHGIEKPSGAHFFRGFIRSKGVHSPVFLLNGQPDPSDPAENGNSAPDNVDNEDDQVMQDAHALAVALTPGKESSQSQNTSKSVSPDFHGYTTIDQTTFKEVFAAQNEVDTSSNLLEAVEAGEKDKNMGPCLSGEDGSNVDDEDPFVSLEDFSDIEDEDTPEYTQTRIERKLYRYHLRREQPEANDLCKREGNVEFIKDFEKFVLKKNLSRNTDKSNIDKSVGHIAGYDDSLLNFLTKKNPNFTLSCLVAFKDKDRFVKLKDPLLDWIKEIAGESGLENASRQKEKLKAHSDLRRYIIKKLKQTDFGNNLLDILWAQKMREHIDEVTADIHESGVFSCLNRVIDQNRQKVLIAKSLINPAQDQKEAKSLGVYFSSEQFKNREISLNKIFLEAVEKQEVNYRDFQRVGNFARVLLALMDRLRRSAYKFTNNDYGGRQPRWIPAGANTDDFYGVPDGLLSEEPEDKRPPDMYIIKLSGETQKGGYPATITINQKAEQWLQKFRQLKSVVFGSPLDPEEPFFQNVNKKPFGNITNSKGSMLAEFSSVTGVKNFTTTGARRTLQQFIQNNEVLKANTTTVSQHSQAVASKHYDRGDADFRATAMHHIGESEGTNAVSSNIMPDSDEIVAKRRKINQEDLQIALKKAQETVDMANTRNVKVGPRCKIKQDDRKFMQTIFAPGGKLENIVADGERIKDAANFTRSFYRLLDGEDLSDEDGGRLLDIESSIFRVVKEDILKKDKSWEDTLEDNKKADRMIGDTILKSFRAYERNKKDDAATFFSFKK